MVQSVLSYLYNGGVVGTMYLKWVWMIARPCKELFYQVKGRHSQDMDLY